MPLDLVKENVIDINNPPKVPYHFQEFPKLVYHHESSSPSSIEEKVSPDGKSREEIHVPAKLTSRVVNDKEQLRTALEAGFSEQPPTFQEPVAPQESKKGRK